MTGVSIAAIVEGHGEEEAVPVLIRRIAALIDPGFVPIIPHPIRIPASKLKRQGELERAVEFAARKLQFPGGILILLDCDDACPAIDGPALLDRAKTVRNDLPISVVLAKKEFETWFLAAAESLRGKRGLSGDLTPPPDPESIRGAKGWLRHQMPRQRTYTETEDQAALTAIFDMDAARTADSFDKCFREIMGLLQQLRQQNGSDDRTGSS